MCGIINQRITKLLIVLNVNLQSFPFLTLLPNYLLNYFFLQQSEKVKASGDLDDIKEQPPKFITHFQDGEENSDGDLSSSMMTTTETDCTISPTISHQHLALSRQTSKSSLLSMKLTLPNSGPGSPSSSSQRSLGYSCKSGIYIFVPA